jgi:tetratricopeptide (TPR) repeat protein
VLRCRDAEKMKIPGEVRQILEKKVFHEQKIALLQALVEKNPETTIIHDFITAEKLLIKKNGLRASKIYDSIAARTNDPAWLVERMAKTLAKYAYHDLGSGPIQMAHDIFTQRLGMDDEKAWKKLADILKRGKGFGFAAQCYGNAGMAGTAARMFEKLKQKDRAAWYYEQNKEYVRAARCYKSAKLHDKSGETYAKAGMLKLAVQQWKKAGTLEKHNIGEQMMQQILRR